MSFLRAARAARAGQNGSSPDSCGRGRYRSWPDFFFPAAAAAHRARCLNHTAYVTVPATGSVLLLHINGSTGAITLGAQTPPVQNTSPTGLALLPSKKFLYVVNSRADYDLDFQRRQRRNFDAQRQSDSGRLRPMCGGHRPFRQVLVGDDNNLLKQRFRFLHRSRQRRFVRGRRVALLREWESNRDSRHAFRQVRLRDQSRHRDGHRFSFSRTACLLQCPGAIHIPLRSSREAGASGLAVDASERFLYVANPSAINLTRMRPPPATFPGSTSTPHRRTDSDTGLAVYLH